MPYPGADHCKAFSHGQATRSAARDTHVPRHRRTAGAAVDDEVMALWLAADGFVYSVGNQFIAFGRAQRGAQVGCVFLAKAHIERARASQPDPVAAFAEIMRHRRDEA